MALQKVPVSGAGMAREGLSVLCFLGPGGSGCAGEGGTMRAKGQLAVPTQLRGGWGWGGVGLWEMVWDICFLEKGNGRVELQPQLPSKVEQGDG